jgi:hypothetical protein
MDFTFACLEQNNQMTAKSLSLISDPVIKIPISADHGRYELSKVRSKFDGSSSSGGGAISE